MKKKTHEEYVHELETKNPTVEVVGEYIDANTKIEHHCLTHDVYWNTTPSRALQGVGCEICRKEKDRTKRCKSHEEYIEELKNVNPKIILLEKYVDAKTPIMCKCLKHDVEWKIYPDSLLRGHGCYKCGNEKIGDKNKKSSEKYIEELKEINPKIIAIDTYVDANTPILHKCLIDGHKWYATPGNILYGTGCPKCAGNIKMTQDEYVNKVSLINPNIEVIGKYINAKTPILHRCKIDGNTWSTVSSVILSGCGCPKCKDSKGEKFIRQWLDNHSIIYECQKRFNDCKDINSLPFDFYLPDYNTLIEYDGEQHYKPVEHFGGEKEFKKRLKHDTIKNSYCKCNNIRLLRIPFNKNIKEELNNFLFI